jgi:hypothetical protein
LGDDTLSFGAVGIETTRTRFVSIENSGSGSISGNVGVPQATDFFVTSGAGPFTLPSSKSMQVAVEFAPHTAATAKAELPIIIDNPGATSLRVPLNGRGVPGVLAVPSRLQFPRTKVRIASLATLRIRNSGGGVLHGIVGHVEAPFFVHGGGAFSLGPHESLNVEITFAPEVKGENPARELAITSQDASTHEAIVTLRGEAH